MFTAEKQYMKTRQVSIDTAGEGEGGAVRWESSTDLYTPGVKQTASGELRGSTGRSARCSVLTWRMGRGNGRAVQERGDTHTLMGDSRSRTAETSTAL